MENSEVEKPKAKVIGKDGNVFVVRNMYICT